MRSYHAQPIYTFTNEGLDGYMPHICAGAKSGLIVSASGDQIITANREGVNDILAFDINANANLFANLKINAMKTFNYLEFLRFFKDEQYLNSKLFDKLPMYTDLDQVILRGMPKWGGCFTEDGKHNTYIRNADTYNDAKKKLKNLNVQFVNSSIKDLPEHIGDRYFDIAMFSNIGDHYADGYPQFFNEVGEIAHRVDKMQLSYNWSSGRAECSDRDLRRFEQKNDYKMRKFIFDCENNYKHSILIGERGGE